MLVLLASPTTAFRPTTTLNPCRGEVVTAKQASPFIERVWDQDRWMRGKPKASAVAAYRLKVRCAAGPGHRRAIANHWSRDRLRYGRHRHRMQARADYLDAITPPGIEVLETIAACESGGDPTAVSADGSYRGKYQFSYETWASVGGSGDPAAAPEREQDERAARLYREAGPGPWPVCGL